MMRCLWPITISSPSRAPARWWMASNSWPPFFIRNFSPSPRPCNLTTVPPHDIPIIMCKHEEKYCPRCKAAFECKVGGIAQCQCFGIGLTPEEKAFLENRYEDV